MAKPTGFIEYQREERQYTDALERIKNWDEFLLPMSDEKLNEQSARCMNCGIPFCHTGNIINGAVSGCPINNLIPEWNDLVYHGMWREAYERLRKTNNFPEFTGRVCPAPCEGACTAGLVAEPVTIKNIEYTIIEKAYEEGWVNDTPPLIRSGRKIAVVGSGPAGLACADELNQFGHMVTVYERSDRVGGLLMYGIPNMKLDKDIIQRRLDVMSRQGVNFMVDTQIGKDISAKELLEEFDAVVLCAGSTKARDLSIKGREANGIHFAMDYLHGNTKQLLDQKTKNAKKSKVPFISAADKDVVVIGGGDTGTDCVATSLRHGCKSVTQLEILPMPPATRAANNPWPEWPKVFKQDYGQKEFQALYGRDPRTYLTTATEFLKDNDGNLTGIKVVDVVWDKDEQGRFTPIFKNETERVIPAQLVLIAMGFTGPEEALINAFEVETDQRGNVASQDGHYATSVKGVFSAGDMRRGQSLVVWAINEGRGAAKECDQYLRSL